MGDYIKRKCAYDALCKICNERDACEHTGQEGCHQVFAQIPAADVRENVRGKWIHHDDDMYGDYWECSNCHDEFCLIEGDMYYNFCPNCGAGLRKDGAAK